MFSPVARFIVPLTVLWLASADAYGSVASEALQGRHVKTVTNGRSLDIYTWENRASFRPVGGTYGSTDPRVFAFFEREVATFADRGQPRRYVGPNGVYFATDPLSSREWGGGGGQRPPGLEGPNWSVTRVRLPSGTRFLDGRSTRPFGPELARFVQGYRCQARNMRELVLTRSRGYTGTPQCYEAYVALARELSASAIALNTFRGAYGPASVCGLHNETQTDFIMISSSEMTDYRSFGIDIPPNDPDAAERTFIQAYMTAARASTEGERCRRPGQTPSWESRWSGDACHYYWASPARFVDPWPAIASLWAHQDPASFVRAFVSSYAGELERILGCASRQYPEDAP